MTGMEVSNKYFVCTFLGQQFSKICSVRTKENHKMIMIIAINNQKKYESNRLLYYYALKYYKDLVKKKKQCLGSI